MRLTIRASVFETNSSASHNFIYMSKNTFEAWKRGEKVLDMNGHFHDVYTEKDFKDTIMPVISKNWEHGTYEGIVEFYESSGGSHVPRDEAKREFVDPEQWEDVDESWDYVYQNAYMEVIDNGRTVLIHIWGK
ncbi:MAG: hypothetical protein LBH69_04890 [Methanomassiliicoccaceae archaeon]|jgi:hypothetical protein|nr:hypothetical protein [Methanomassiliicoccaceae archaeon]